MKRESFSFGGVNSLDFGVWITGADTENTPGRDMELRNISGKNGAVVMDNGRWQNGEVRFRCAIIEDFSRNYGHLMAALWAKRGYQKLQDSLRPGEYRMAVLREPVKPETTPYNRAGRFDLSFSCKPQRFLAAGERTVHFGASGTLYNPTAFPAQPVITVTGEGPGWLSVGGRDVQFHELGGTVVLDCESMDAFARVDGGVESRNSWIRAPEFPVLEPGKNQISFDGGITGVEIVPRWWTL